jgi:hypothetical protein
MTSNRQEQLQKDYARRALMGCEPTTLETTECMLLHRKVTATISIMFGSIEQRQNHLFGRSNSKGIARPGWSIIRLKYHSS